jgi:hypothetical protein
MPGEPLTRWTVRLALLLYAATLALRLTSPAHRQAARLLWTIGCILFLAHVAAAFQYFHGWSHANAYRETARRTAELFGTNWGGGLYFNYVFTLAWAADVVWWWAKGSDGPERRPRWVEITLQAFMFFMAFNATVVFERGIVRWTSVAITVALSMLLARSVALTHNSPLVK